MGLSSLSLKPKFTHPLLNPGGTKFRQKAGDLENKLLEMQKWFDELSQETQEQESKVNQLQEMIERY